MDQTQESARCEADNLLTDEEQAVNLRGIWAPCLTPVLEDFSIDYVRLCQHVDWLLNNGCQGVVLFGTTGESASFCAAERMIALKKLLMNDVPASRIILGNGFTAISESVDVTKHAVELGCRAVLMIPPFYFKNPSVQGLTCAYQYVLDAIDCPDLKVLLYHFPKMSTIPITYELIDALMHSHGELIAGLKDSSGSWDSVQDYIQRYPDLAIFPGTDTLLLKGLQSGGVGTITATANINPHGISRVYQLWQAGENAQSAQKAADSIRTIVSRYPLAAALKTAHAKFRDDSNWNRLRPPLVPLASKDQKALIESLLAAGFEFSA